MSSSDGIKGSLEIHDDEGKFLKLEPKKNKSSCCGREFSRTSCSKVTLIVGAVVGGIILVLGLLALIGYSAPAGSKMAIALQQVNQFTASVAAKLGTDPLTLSVCVTSISAGLSIGTIGSLIYLRVRKEKPYRAEPND